MNQHILVVDDEKNIRMTLTQCLNEEEYTVDLAVNGEDALIQLSQADYDLVLLDIKMPGVDGMEVLKQIRTQGLQVNVIMMTAYGTVERAVEAMKLGAVDFISKPFTPAEIRKLVRSVLSRHVLKETALIQFEDYLEFAKKCLLEQDYAKAEEILKKSIPLNVEAPEPHNLLGVLAEYHRDLQRAQKHYRAALALDPTYRPADQNLERTVQWKYTQAGMNLGDEDDSDER
ncbi:response regulator [Anoxynatronum sibiricum]|uniref:Stage 0 sporulation protein A homolog n=1 Tax=Anoxynatronum sibiricum TaxID=210623 RepID=A0ABU9VU29_9CLOT